MLSRELRLLLASPLLWVVVAAAAALALVTQHAAVLVLSLALPFVVAQVASDHASTRALLQLGRRPLSLTAARATALALACALALVPPLALKWVRAPDDPGAWLTTAIGLACVGAAVIGIGMFAAALTSSRAAATLATLAVTGGAWALDATRAPLSFAMPTAALRVFERGLVDGKDVVTLLAGALGLALASSALSSRTAPLEARAARCAAILVLTALVCGGASQVRVSADLTRAQRASFPAAWATALALVRDRVEVTVHARRDDPRVEELELRVLTPLRRYAKVRTRFVSGPVATTGDALVTWRVGGREAPSDAVTADAAIPLVLDLAGVPLAR